MNLPPLCICGYNVLMPYRNNTQNSYLQLEIRNQCARPVMSQRKSSPASAPCFWHWPKAQEREYDSPSHMKFSRVWINWNQAFSTIGNKPHNDIRRGQFKLSIFFHVCRQLILNSERMIKKDLILYCFKGIPRRDAYSCSKQKMGFWAINSSRDFPEDIISLPSLPTRW